MYIPRDQNIRQTNSLSKMTVILMSSPRAAPIMAATV